MQNKTICQSCGMPLKKEEDLGVNKDKSKNAEYCKYCYQMGSFTDEGISMNEKIKKNIDIAKKMGMDEKKAKDLAESTIPKLKRWKAK